MTNDELEGLRRTLVILHLLADLGVVEQVLGDGSIRWVAKKDAKRRLALILKALRKAP